MVLLLVRGMVGVRMAARVRITIPEIIIVLTATAPVLAGLRRVVLVREICHPIVLVLERRLPPAGQVPDLRLLAAPVQEVPLPAVPAQPRSRVGPVSLPLPAAPAGKRNRGVPALVREGVSAVMA